MPKLYLIVSVLLGSFSFIFAQKSTIEHLDNPLPTYWKLKSPDRQKDKDKCKDCWHPVEDIKVSRVYREGNQYIFYMNDIRRAKVLFANKRDGVSLEFVAKGPYRCEDERYTQMPGRRNQQSLFNGMLTKPVYKKKIFKPWKAEKKRFRKQKKRRIAALRDSMSSNSRTARSHRKKAIRSIKKDKFQPQSLKISLGERPVLQQAYGFNLVLIKKKKVCRVEFFGNVHRDNFSLYEPVPLLFDWPDRTSCKLEYPPIVLRDTFRISFDKGDANLDYHQVRDSIELIGKKGLGKFSLKNVEIRAFASVEGKHELNKRLKYERAMVLTEAIKEGYGAEDLAPKIQTDVNWTLFRTQLAESSNPRLRKISKRPRTSLEKLVNNPRYEAIFEPMLKKQREAIISLELEFERTEWRKRETALHIFHQWLETAIIDSLEVDYSDLQAAACWQRHIYELVQESPSRAHLISRMQIPLHPKLRKLHNNYLMMREQMSVHGQVMRGKVELPQIDEAEHYTLLDSLVKQKPSNPVVTYNRLAFLLERWSPDRLYDPMIPPDSMFRLIDALTPKAHRYRDMDIEKLWINYHFKSANYFMNKAHRRDYLLTSLNYLHKYYQKQTLSVEHAMGLARLFIKGRRHRQAAEIIQPLASLPNPDPELYSLYLKLFFQHPHEYPDTRFYESLLNARAILGDGNWCRLFAGNEAIPFQAFDHQALREVYCEICE